MSVYADSMNNQRLQLWLKQRVTEQLSRSSVNITRVDISVDPRISALKCEIPLAYKASKYAPVWGRYSVTVMCAQEQSYKRNIRVEVKVYAEVFRLTSALRRATILMPANIELAEIELSSLRDTPISNAKDIIGLETKYALRSGRELTAKLLRQPIIVHRGEIRYVSLTIGSLSVSDQFKILEDGRQGDRIKLLNTTSNKVVYAQVGEHGELVLVRP